MQATMMNQIVGFYRMAFETAFTAWAMAQEQSHRIAGAVCDQSPWLPEECRTQYGRWMAVCSQNRDVVKHLVDDGFTMMERFSRG